MKFKNLLFFFCCLFVLTSCKREELKKDYTLEGAVFGTTYKITYLQATKNYQESLDSLFLLMNNSLSTYVPTSDISKINSGESKIKIDTLFKEVFFKSKRIHKETDGFFDPTVGNLVNAYGFGPKNEKGNLTDEEVQHYMQWVGLDKVILKNDAIVKEHPKIYLDFNSIAKGFGVDVVARFFDKQNISSYLIEIGGEIRARGLKANQKPWLIRIVDPVNVDTGFKVINLSDKSIATSGNYRKFRVTEDGEKYVHTINPKSGLAQESTLLSASVISKIDCADLDAYATAFMAMGLEKTKLFLKENSHLKVILIYANKNGELEEYTTYK